MAPSTFNNLEQKLFAANNRIKDRLSTSAEEQDKMVAEAIKAVFKYMPKAAALEEKQFDHVFKYGDAISKTKGHRTGEHLKELEVMLVRAEMEARRNACRARIRNPLLLGAGFALVCASVGVGIGVAEMGRGYRRTAMAADRENTTTKNDVAEYKD